MTLSSTGRSSPAEELDQRRSRNWVAITVATLLMMFCYFTYAAAFVEGTGDAAGLEPRLIGVALAISPFVFVALAFVSQNITAPRDVLRAMGLLLAVALGVGLLDPLLGAATGFAAGGALTLRRAPIEGIVRWRVSAVLFTFVYLIVLLIAVPAGGIFAGAVAPLMMIGIADEFAAWSASKS